MSVLLITRNIRNIYIEVTNSYDRETGAVTKLLIALIVYACQCMERST